MIERDFNVPFVAQLAQREKQIQQSYRPIIGVHKWFARRPGALFRALLLAEFINGEPLEAAYFNGHKLSEVTVGDPFMGGGTPLFEANRLGCHVVGTDVNPMAYWIVRQELGALNRESFLASAKQVIADVEAVIGELYKTNCTHCGSENAAVKYFLWVKEQPCQLCEKPIRLYTKYTVAKNQRHPNHVLACPVCETLNEVSDLDAVEKSFCCNCTTPLQVQGPARRNRIVCSHCAATNTYPNAEFGPLKHHLFAIEYHCDVCQQGHQGRFFKSPDERDRARVQKAEEFAQGSDFLFVPTEGIPSGDESDRLHRWGYERYRDLFSSRQLFGLNVLAERIAAVEEDSIRHALLTVFSDTLRYQNMVCRYDTYALKIIDIFSIHGFPVQPIQCENSLLGVPGIGSGGFRHFVEKYDRAKAYCEAPFEKTIQKKRKVFPKGETIRGKFIDSPSRNATPRTIYIQASSAADMELPPNILDAVLTDPPYFGNVQYAELMDFCYVWLKRHLGATFPAFQQATTRTNDELTVNQTAERGIEHFAAGLSESFTRFALALKPGRPFAFTYHHNELEAYLPVIVALLDARLVATATLPCPAEMSASIHISGTKSSTVDTVFVCRTTGTLQPKRFQKSEEDLKELLRWDLEGLQRANLKPSVGDAYCLLLGHLARIAVWELRSKWQPSAQFAVKLRLARATVANLCPEPDVERLAKDAISSLVAATKAERLREAELGYQAYETLSF